MSPLLAVLSIATTLTGGGEPKPLEPWLEAENLGFELGGLTPEGWAVLSSTGPTPALARDLEQKQAGRSALRIEVAEGGRGRIGQRVAGEPGATVVLEGWTRSSGAAKSNVYLAPIDRRGARLAFVQAEFLQGDQPWRPFTATAVLPSDAVGFEVGVVTEGAGSTWLDEFKLRSTPGAVRRPLVDPEFQDPILPYPGRIHRDERLWLQMHERLAQEARLGSAKVVFLGDSITELWDAATWAQRFAPLGAANFGIRGDRTNQVLWRLQHGELDGLKPDLVVLAIGVNNLWRDRYGARRNAQGVGRIVRELRRIQPQAKVLVVSVLPTDPAAASGFRTIVPELNRQMRRYVDGHSVWMVDPGPSFLASDGSIPKRLMPDGLHLSPEGYRVYADQIAPMVRELISADRSVTIERP